jgi:hypothetical protein
LWRKSRLVWVEPRGVAFTSDSGLRRIEADPAHGSEPWHGALAALEAEASALLNERLDVTVVLSNAFARFALVPRQSGTTTQDEDEVLARFRFSSVHGERARGWEVRVSRRGAAGRLACAIDTALLSGLQACFSTKSRARLASVQPYLMHAFNRWRRKIPREGAWLALAEPARVCLALVTSQGWRALSNLPAPAQWREILARERRRAGGETLPATLLAHETGLADPPPLGVSPAVFRLAA